MVTFVQRRYTSYARQVQRNLQHFDAAQSAKLERRIEKAVNSARCTKCKQLIGNNISASDADTSNEPSPTHQLVEARNDYPVQRVVSFYRSNDNKLHSDNNVMVNVSRTKNLVSRLTQKFENAASVGHKFNRSMSTHENRRFSWTPDVPKRSAISADPSDDELSGSESPEFLRRPTTTTLLGRRSNGGSQRSSMENILERDDECSSDSCDDDEDAVYFRERSHSASDVRCVEDILQQERFSKCFSEYSISDLVNGLAMDDYTAAGASADDEEITLFNK